MISEKEANEILGEDLVKAYHETHRVKGDWGSYVSLPLIYLRFGIDLSNLFDRKVLIFSHPGFCSYTEEAMEKARERKKRYGDYEKEYFEPLMKRNAEAIEKKEKRIVYAPDNKLKETLKIIGSDDLILVPTDEESDMVREIILGVSGYVFLRFLKKMGVKEAEHDGEVKGRCYTAINNQIKDSKIKVSQNIHFPVRGSYDGKIELLYLTEGEERFFLQFERDFDEWSKRTYREHTSRLGIEEGSCAAIIFKKAIENATVDYIPPWQIHNLSKKFGREEVEKALEKLKSNGVLKSGPATELLDEESLLLFNKFNRLHQERDGYESDEVILLSIGCDLFK